MIGSNSVPDRLVAIEIYFVAGRIGRKPASIHQHRLTGRSLRRNNAVDNEFRTRAVCHWKQLRAACQHIDQTQYQQISCYTNHTYLFYFLTVRSSEGADSPPAPSAVTVYT